VECRDCGLIRLIGPVPAACTAGTAGESLPGSPDPELAAEVERALAKVLGKTAKVVAAP
jgi:hypothetical protein